MKPLATLSPSVTEFDILVDMRLVEIDQLMAIPLCLGQQRTELRDKGLPPLGIGINWSISTRRISTRRRSVQRGFGSAPVTGGLAASWRAARTASPSAASMSGQSGGGHRCADKPVPRAVIIGGRDHCTHAASPSRSGDGGPYVRPRQWHSCLG